MKNVKNLAIHESIEYVKKSSQKIAGQLSKEHQQLALQFLHFKEKTFEKMDRMEKWHEEMKVVEKALALKNPVLEAEYIINTHKQPLGLYDCYLPQLKQLMKSKAIY